MEISCFKTKLFGALLTDSSKIFHCLSHDLLLAKLYGYGFSLSGLNLIHCHLKIRKQRTKINSTYSSSEEILSGVLQGYILGHLLLDIFLCDQFFPMNETDFASYEEDNKPCQK